VAPPPSPPPPPPAPVIAPIVAPIETPAETPVETPAAAPVASEPDSSSSSTLSSDSEVSEVVVAAATEEKSSGEKIDIRFGIRMGYSINDFSFGPKAMDAYLGVGQSLWVGVALNVPIANFIMLNAGIDFYYRELFTGAVNYCEKIRGLQCTDLRPFEGMDESVISIPILLQFGIPFYFTAGVQLDIPFDVETYYETETPFGTKKENPFADNLVKDRSPIDFGLAVGLGYRFTHFVLDFKFVYVLTDLFDGYEKSSLWQYSFGASHFF
jgi:hypothetical protein